jgi:hypothetical protein
LIVCGVICNRRLGEKFHIGQLLAAQP